ncbi:MAG TPA: hypothetical protein VGM37_02495 [Armatimonadota bacterium]|jgi:predicted RecA/RadA family phage recombinase
MADIAVTAAAVAPARAKFESFSFIAAAAITKGAAVYITAAGKVDNADASLAASAGAIGIALSSVGAGQAVEVLTRGPVAGYNLTAQAYGATIYLSDTDSGILADAAGTTSKKVGIVLPTSDNDLTKVLFVCPALV